MTEEQKTELIIRGMASKLSAEELVRLNECVAKLNAVIDEYGNCGLLALAMVGASLAAK